MGRAKNITPKPESQNYGITARCGKEPSQWHIPPKSLVDLVLTLDPGGDMLNPNEYMVNSPLNKTRVCTSRSRGQKPTLMLLLLLAIICIVNSGIVAE